MRIKRFTAPNSKMAMKMVKDELGPEAVILASRQVNGPDGPCVEITAGAGYTSAAEPAPAPAPAHLPSNAAPAPADKPVEASPALGDLQRELAEVKELLLDMTHRQDVTVRLRHRRDLVRIYRDLVDAELAPALARRLVEAAGRSQNGAGPLDMVKSRLVQSLPACVPGFPAEPGHPEIVVLIGPSGVGKTTTISKLAALWSVKQKRRVAMVSLDTYRLGAAEQLRTYARVMGLPVRVAQSREEFAEALELFDDRDMILVDTPGRFLCRGDQFEELSRVLAGIQRLRVLLVLSATTKDRDLAAAIERARPLSTEALVITKIDETQRYGNIINNLVRFQLPVAFLTNGQKVPDDLITTTPDRLARLVVRPSAEPSGMEQR